MQQRCKSTAGMLTPANQNASTSTSSARSPLPSTHYCGAYQADCLAEFCTSSLHRQQQREAQLYRMASTRLPPRPLLQRLPQMQQLQWLTHHLTQLLLLTRHPLALPQMLPPPHQRQQKQSAHVAPLRPAQRQGVAIQRSRITDIMPRMWHLAP